MAQSIMSATSALPAVLVSDSVGDSLATYYTCPSASSVKLSTASICNTESSPVEVSIHLVQAGVEADETNRVISEFPLAAGDSSVVVELVGAVLGPGDFIAAQASSSDAVNLTLTGVVFS